MCSPLSDRLCGAAYQAERATVWIARLIRKQHSFGFLVVALLVVSCRPESWDPEPRKRGSVERAEPEEVLPPRGAALAYSARSGGPAALGGVPAQAALSSMKRAASAHGLSLSGDDRLARLAEWFATVTQQLGGSPSLEAIDFATRHLGMIEPLPALLVAVQRQGRWEPPLDSLFNHAPRNIRYNRVGVAVVPVGSVNVAGIALSSSHADTSYVPRSVSKGSRIWFDGQLGEGYRQPELAITQPNGSTRRVTLGSQGSFSTQLDFSEIGRTQVEVLATGPSGLEVVANFPVFVGTPPPGAVRVARGQSESAEAAVATLSDLLNDERQKSGLAPLEFDSRLAEVAAEHSADMVEQRFFGHESPTRGDPMRRTRRAGMSLNQLGENVGRGPSAKDLHHLLMGSPGHRGNILRPEFTHVGIGVVGDDSSGERVLLATQLFASAPRVLSEPQFKSRLLALVNQSRVKSRALPLELDTELERVACADAAVFASGAKNPGPPRADPRPVSDWKAVLNGAYDPEDAAKAPALHVPTARRVGVCAAATEPSVLAARTVVIVVSASSFPKLSEGGSPRNAAPLRRRK